MICHHQSDIKYQLPKCFESYMPETKEQYTCDQSWYYPLKHKDQIIWASYYCYQNSTCFKSSISIMLFQYLQCTYNVKRQKLTTGIQNQTAWFDCCLCVQRHSNCMLIHVKAKERKQIIKTEIYIPNIRTKQCKCKINLGFRV